MPVQTMFLMAIALVWPRNECLTLFFLFFKHSATDSTGPAEDQEDQDVGRSPTGARGMTLPIEVLLLVAITLFCIGMSV